MTPQLRFPEFTDEWQVKLLGKIFDVRDGTHESPAYFDHGKPLLTSKNLKPNGTLDLDNVSYISQHDFDSINRRSGVNVGDILFGMIGTIGNPVKVESSDFAIKNVALLKPGEVSSNYLIQYLRSQIIEKQFYQKNAGGTQKFIALGDIRELNIGTPSKPEQEKIADFLTAVDERIRLQEQKLAKLEQYKRGVMQQIFSQKIRFKDENGNEYPEWEEKKLGDIFNGLKGSGLSISDLAPDGQSKCILYGQLYTTYPEVIKSIKGRTDSAAGVSSKKNDLLLPCSTTTTGIDLADATALNEDGVRLGGDISILRFKEDGSNIFYAYYLSHYKKTELASYGQGSTIVHMYFSHFKNMAVDVPSVAEQQKIATFLTTLDDKITAEKSKLTAAKQFKKALLQRMFV